MAKRFAFRLDRVLQLRVTEEQQAARQLAAAQRAVDAARITIDAGVQRLAHAVEQAAHATAEMHTAGMLRALLFTIDVAREQVQRDREALAAAEQALEREQAVFNEARAARMALDKLREQKLQDWTLEEGRNDQRASDDAARRVTAKTGDSA